MEITYEYCPHCDTEVKLKAELSVQKCPVCGMWIVACTMCEECTATCVLDDEARRLNELHDETARNNSDGSDQQ